MKSLTYKFKLQYLKDIQSCAEKASISNSKKDINDLLSLLEPFIKSWVVSYVNTNKKKVVNWDENFFLDMYQDIVEGILKGIKTYNPSKAKFIQYVKVISYNTLNKNSFEYSSGGLKFDYKSIPYKKKQFSNSVSVELLNIDDVDEHSLSLFDDICEKISNREYIRSVIHEVFQGNSLDITIFSLIHELEYSGTEVAELLGIDYEKIRYLRRRVDKKMEPLQVKKPFKKELHCVKI